MWATADAQDKFYRLVKGFIVKTIFLMQLFLSSAIYHLLDVELLIKTLFLSPVCYFTLDSGQASKLD